MTIEIEEEQRQMIVLALAHLAVIRPGWKMALADTALTMDDGGMFKQFFEIWDQRLRHNLPDDPTTESLKKALEHYEQK